jgi:hypothetical protein
MADVLFLAILAGFFLLCVGFVKVCDRLVEAGGTGDK